MKSLLFLFLFVLSINSYARTYKAQILGTQESLFEERNADNEGKTSDQIYKESIDMYKAFVNGELDKEQHQSIAIKDADKATTITMTEANTVYKAINKNPVVSTMKAKKDYDPSKRTGFCFGRAMFGNLYMATSGLNRDSMKKVFILGSMDGGTWGWHVAIAAKGTIGNSKKIQWLVIDPEVGKVVELREWYDFWRNGSSDDGTLRLYITDAGRFGASPSQYDQNGLSDPFYNSYFDDMMTWFEQDFKQEILKN